MVTQGEKIATLEANQSNLMKEVGEIKTMLSAHIQQEDLNYKEFLQAIKDWQEVANDKFATKEEIDNKLKLPNLLVKGVIGIVGLIIAGLITTGLLHIFPNINL